MVSAILHSRLRSGSRRALLTIDLRQLASIDDPELRIVEDGDEFQGILAPAAVVDVEVDEALRNDDHVTGDDFLNIRLGGTGSDDADPPLTANEEVPLIRVGMPMGAPACSRRRSY